MMGEYYSQRQVPLSHLVSNKGREIMDNKELINFLKEKAKKGELEIERKSDGEPVKITINEMGELNTEIEKIINFIELRKIFLEGTE